MKATKPLLFFAICLALLFVSSYSQESQTEQPQPGFDFVRLQRLIISNITDTKKFFYEFMLVIILVIYVTNYFLGKKLNEKYVLLWTQQNKPFFDTEFAHVGVGPGPEGAFVQAESANSFKFYASGRQNCESALVTLDYKKRQDLLSMFIFNLIWPERDRLRVDIVIDTPVAQPFVFAVTKRRGAKDIQSNNNDVKNFCRRMPHAELEKSYAVFGETEETSSFVLTNAVVSTLKKNENVVESIIISDLRQSGKQFLRAELNVPSDYLKNPAEFQTVFKMLFYLVDQVANFKMSGAGRARAEKERLAYENLRAKEAQKEKQEEIQKKLLEKKKEEQGNKKRDDKKEEQRMKKKMQRKFVKMA